MVGPGSEAVPGLAELTPPEMPSELLTAPPAPRLGGPLMSSPHRFGGRMKVSVIIPTYNRAATVVRAVESVLAQTLPPDEIIVVDDGSTDHTAAVLDRFRTRVRIIVQRNQGASAARNTGIRAASCEVIAFLDSDDYWRPTKLERQMELFRRFPEATCCVCNARLEYETGEVLYSFDVAGLKPATETGLWTNPMEVLVTRFLLFNQVVAVRREALHSAGFFDESLRIMEDYDLQLRLALTGPWTYLREPLVIWQGGTADSLTSSSTDGLARRHAREILRKLQARHDLSRWVAPAVLSRRIWHLSQRITAAEWMQQKAWVPRLAGRALRFGLRLWEAGYYRSTAYPAMISQGTPSSARPAQPELVQQTR